MSIHKVYVVKGDNGYLAAVADSCRVRYFATETMSMPIITRPSLKEIKKKVLPYAKNLIVNPKIKVWEIEEKDLDESK